MFSTALVVNEYTIISLFNKSMAFLEVAILSSKSKDNILIQNTSEYSNVTAYLLYHSTELFLKFAIATAMKEIEQIHDIKKLNLRYQELYADEKYKIDIPFTKEQEYIGFTEEEIKKHKKKYSMKFEQQLKYPVDGNGENYYPITVYTTEYLEDYRQKLLKLYQEICSLSHNQEE